MASEKSNSTLGTVLTFVVGVVVGYWICKRKCSKCQSGAKSDCKCNDTQNGSASLTDNEKLIGTDSITCK